MVIPVIYAVALPSELGKKKKKVMELFIITSPDA